MSFPVRFFPLSKFIRRIFAYLCINLPKEKLSANTESFDAGIAK